MSQQSINAIRRIIEIHQASDGVLRPHHMIVGPSGSGKSFNVAEICKSLDVEFFEVNCAQLTKEGLSGNSLSKALVPLGATGLKPVVCFMDEFDKLFISGNANDRVAHECTNGVQNEMLKLLESPTTQVMGDYGHFNEIGIGHVLFIFAGAFNGATEVDLDTLRDFGIKTEFLGRVGLVFNLEKVSLEEMLGFVDTSHLLQHYSLLMPDADMDKVRAEIKDAVRENYDQNTLGVRMLNTLIHQYFVHGTLKKTAKQVTFQKTLKMPPLHAEQDLFAKG